MVIGKDQAKGEYGADYIKIRTSDGDQSFTMEDVILMK